MKRRPFLLLLVFVLVLLPGTALANVAEFWPDGFIVGDDPRAFFKIEGQGVRAVAVQPWDGRIIIGGDFSITTGTPQKTWKNLARINTDGSLDQSFTATPDGPVNAIAIVKEAGAPQQLDYQPIPKLDESRIYIGGSFGHVSPSPDFVGEPPERHGLARLRCGDGSLDAFAPLAAGAIDAIVADPDGKSILVGGLFSGTVATPGGPLNYRNIARISIAAPDDGTVTGTFSGGTEGEVYAIVLQEALVVIGGKASTAGKYLARFGADGTPDTAFAAVTNGVVRSLALQADGKVLVGGDFATVNGTPRNYLARLKMDGTLDTLFDGALENPGAGAGYHVAAIAVQPDGRIVAGGKFGRVGGAVRNHAVRLEWNGALDTSIDPGTNGAVSALAMEPNGRFLVAGEFAAAAGKVRSRIARFYCNGALDDFAPNPGDDPENIYWLGGNTHSAGVRPDGTLQLTGEGEWGIHRLKPDWSLDLSLENYWMLGGWSSGPIRHAQIVDDDSVVGVGRFTNLQDINNDVTYPAYGVMSYDSKLLPDPNFGRYFNSLYSSLPYFDVQLGEGPFVVAALPPHSKTSKETMDGETVVPKGSPLEEGMVYVGGGWEPTAAGQPSHLYLVRLKRNGDVDTSFNAALLDGYVTAIYIQPDDKIIVGGLFPGSDGFTGGLRRLDTNGDLDASFKAPEFRVNVPNLIGINYAEIDAISVAKDGESMLVGGYFGHLKDKDGTYERIALVRLKKVLDGTVERWTVDSYEPSKEEPGVLVNVDPYNVGNVFTDSPGVYNENKIGLPTIQRMARQTDGDMYAAGLFDTITPAGGESFVQFQVVRLDAHGNIYTDAIPEEGDAGHALDHVTSLLQQPDGKLIFVKMAGDAFGSLRRFSNGWATEELSVSPDGEYLTWMRAGTSPEVWGVYFEEAADPKGPWTYLGRGRSIDGGWRLDREWTSDRGWTFAEMTALPKLENRYVRARAYTEGHSWEPTVSVIESVRQYYLKHPLQVSAADSGKVYGGPEISLSYSATGFLPGDNKDNALTGNVARQPGNNARSYPITQGTLSGGDKYTIIYTGANYVITPATLTVVAKPASKTTLQTDPVFDFDATGYVNGDDKTVFSGALGREPEGDTAGDYQINKGTLSAAPNYTIDFTGASFTISDGVRASQTITFNGRRFWTYGDADFDPGATSDSGLAVSYTSSNPDVLAVVGGMLKVVGPGTSEITASQEGNSAFLPAGSVTRSYTVGRPPGMSLNFDGINDYMQIEDAPQLNFGSKPGFTVEMWVGPYGSQPNGTVLLTKKNGGSPLTGYQLSIDGNRISALIGDGSSAVSLTGSSALDDWYWHHVALSVDRTAGVGRLYFDGRLEAELTDPRFTANPDNSDPILLAHDRDGSHSYRGDIDELRLWSVARTRDEIRAKAANIIDPALEPDLAAYYHFDEGGTDNPNNTIAPDRTLRGANGVAHNLNYRETSSNWLGSYAFTALLETLPPTSVTATSATGNALIFPNYYDPVDYTICWGTAPNPALNYYGGMGGVLGCAGPVAAGNAFSALLKNLVPGTTYHIQAYAVNDIGPALGNDLLLVPKEDQVITFADIGKVYGAPPFLPTATSTGPVPITYTSSNPAVAVIVDGVIRITGAGTSTITASQGADATHNAAADVAVTLTVDPAALSVAANGKSKTYGGADPALDYAPPTGFVYGDNASLMTGNLLRAGGEDVGSYAIGKGSLSAGANYTILFTGANLVITPAPLTVTANAKTKSYGGAEPALDYAPPTGFVRGDTAAVLTGSLVRAAGEDVGSYAIGKGGLGARNYTISFTGANLTITPVTLTVTAKAKSKIYGAADPLLDCLPPVGLANGDTAAVLQGSLSRAGGENVGSYAIGQGSLNAGRNYTISFTGANLAINPATLKVTANATGKTYGNADPVLDYSADGLTNGDSADILQGSLVRVAGENVGSYDIGKGSLSAGSNYIISFTAAKFTINPAPLTVTANTKTKTYGTADPVLDYLPPVGLTNGDTAAVMKGSLSRVPGENAGSYAIEQGSLNAGPNYTVTFTGANLTITAAPLTITANAKSKGYGTADPALDYGAPAGLANGDTAVVLTGSLSRKPGEAVGSYAIDRGSLSAGPNYTISFTGANLTITPATLTVTANAKSKNYGAADPVLDYAPPAGLLNGDTVAVLTGTLSRAPGEAVGSYAIVQGTLSGGANYTISFTGANLAINPATLAVTANAKTKSYGAADPPLDYTAAGLANGDTVAVLTGMLSRAPGEVPGNYAIGKGTLSAGANYTLSFTGANLVINPATLAVGAIAKSKVYGAADPVFDYAPPAGFVNGDTVAIMTGALSRAPGEGAGSYAIGIGTLSAGSNYTIAFTGANLTITPATLTVSAVAKSKEFGAADPALDFTASGFVNGDTSAILSGALGRVAGETAGVYPITLGTLSAGANYTIAFTGASLTIRTAAGPAPQVITFDPMRPKTFGDGDFDPGATASSGLPVGYASSAPQIAAVAGGKIRVLAPGSTDITASQPGNEHYLPAADVTRTLLVNPPPWNGLGFDGVDDVLRIPDGPQFDFGGKPGYTVETWLHLDGPQPDGTGLVAKAETGSAWSGYQLGFDQDRIAAEIGDGSRTLKITGTTSLDDGQWHHVVLSVERGAGTASLYLDGRLEAQVTDPVLTGSPDNAAALLAGVDRSGSRFFKGEIDELRLWDTPRSREEIRSAVSQIIDPLDEQHLVAYFHLDEGDVGMDNPAFALAPERTAYAANAALQGFALSGAGSNWIRSGAFLPLLETAPVTLGSGGTATGGGLVYPNYYQATDAGLCWGTSPRPGLADTCVHAGSGPGPFTAAMSGLLPGTTYHVRAFAVNLMGTAYGNEIVLETGKLAQTITVNIPEKTYGDPPFPPGGTSTSPLPITYSSSDPGVAIVVNGEIKITGAGTTTITASQPGDRTYNAAEVSVPFTVRKAPLTVSADWKSRAYQTPNPPLTASYSGFVYGETMAVISGAPVLSTTAALSSPVGQYQISVAPGSLAADNYTFILVDGVLSILKSCQEIVFPPIQERTYGDPPIQIIASACSGLGITFTSSDPQVAQVDGSVLTVTGAGTVVITASQSGSDSVDGAPDVSRTVIVHKAGQALSFPALPRKTVGDEPFDPGATASSGLPVSYQSSDTAVAVATGNMIAVVGEGTAVITAIQQGNANYNAALASSQPLEVALEVTPPVIELSTLSSGSVTADPVLNVSGSASDASGIATLTVNGIDFTGREKLFSSAVLLTGGENRVEVIAKDLAGNRSTRTVTVTFDAAAPAITASVPADNSVTPAPFFTVSGTVTPGSAVSLSVNGSLPRSLAVTGGEYAGSGQLQEGVNTLEIAAVLYGRVSTIKRTVTLSPGKPSVAIVGPVEDIRTEQESVTLRGVVAVPEGEAKVVIDVNGSSITPTLQAGAFQQEVALTAPGETRITATVSDSSGNAVTSRRNVIRVAPLLGDLDGDGLVDIRDVALALRISTGLDAASPQTLAHGDLAPLVDGAPRPDGSIGVEDVMVLLRKVLGLANF